MTLSASSSAPAGLLLQVCAHYEVHTEAFTSSCAEAQAKALRPAQLESKAHGSAGARECPQGADGCELSMRHYMRASSMPGERAPPFVVHVPYAAGQTLDNLVIQVEDLNPEDNPTSLSVSLYRTCGMQTCTSTTLAGSYPLAMTDSLPARDTPPPLDKRRSPAIAAFWSVRLVSGCLPAHIGRRSRDGRRSRASEAVGTHRDAPTPPPLPPP